MIEKINHKALKNTKTYIMMLKADGITPKIDSTKLKLKIPTSPQFNPPIANKMKAM